MNILQQDRFHDDVNSEIQTTFDKKKKKNIFHQIYKFTIFINLLKVE